MRAKLRKIVVTGGAGFIGSAFVRLVAARRARVAVVDKLTYAGDRHRIREAGGKVAFYKADIADARAVDRVFRLVRPDVVVNFAAETHVDRSILDPASFLKSNIFGVQVLMDAAKKYRVERFLHLSTDEVYGEIKKGKFREDFPLSPNSPYSASKASADLLLQSYARTYGFPAIIVRPSNNYGPWQYPEKLIPVVIFKAMHDHKVPVYAAGKNVREWLYVDDCARGILAVLEKGSLGHAYNIGSSHERANIEVVRCILDILGKPESLIEFVADRPGHDFRYALETAKIKRLGWKPRVGFEEGIRATVHWYIRNTPWLTGKVKGLQAYWKKVYRK